MSTRFLYDGKKNKRDVEMSKCQEPGQPSPEEMSLPKVLHALSDPVRMEIVLKIAKAGEVACGAFEIPMP